MAKKVKNKPKKKKLGTWIKDNMFVIFGNFFIWVVPLILLVILAFESRTNQVSFKLWGSVVGVILVVVYFLKLRSYVRKKCERELTEQNRIPVYLRLVQLLVAIISFGAIILVASAMKEMYQEIITFLWVSLIAVCIGYVFLTIDSYRRKPQYLNRVSERDCDK